MPRDVCDDTPPLTHQLQAGGIWIGPHLAALWTVSLQSRHPCHRLRRGSRPQTKGDVRGSNSRKGTTDRLATTQQTPTNCPQHRLTMARALQGVRPGVSLEPPRPPRTKVALVVVLLAVTDTEQRLAAGPATAAAATTVGMAVVISTLTMFWPPFETVIFTNVRSVRCTFTHLSKESRGLSRSSLRRCHGS